MVYFKHENCDKLGVKYFLSLTYNKAVSYTHLDVYKRQVQEFMHGSAGVETVCEVYRYSFQAGKRCCFVALRNWKGPYRDRDCFSAQSAGGGGRCDLSLIHI